MLSSFLPAANPSLSTSLPLPPRLYLFPFLHRSYSNYRQVTLYYSGEEDAFDMRRSLPRDPGGASVVPRKPFTCYPHEIEWS